MAAHDAAGRPNVYLDESGFARDMPRTHCYSPCGRRCFGRQDWHTRGRIDVLGPMLAVVLLTAGLTASNVDADIFNLWLRYDPIPKLPPGAVLVMDNATFHERASTSEMIKNAGFALAIRPTIFAGPQSH